MGTLTIAIATDNAAFEHPNAEHEVARILRKLASRLHAGDIDFADHRVGADTGPLLDGYGNTVGSWTFADEAPASQVTDAIRDAYRDAVRTTYGDSNDGEIDAWQKVADLALELLGWTYADDELPIRAAVDAEQTV